MINEEQEAVHNGRWVGVFQNGGILDLEGFCCRFWGEGRTGNLNGASR